jgi:hypothetical protein
MAIFPANFLEKFPRTFFVSTNIFKGFKAIDDRAYEVDGGERRV